MDKNGNAFLGPGSPGEVQIFPALLLTRKPVDIEKENAEIQERGSIRTRRKGCIAVVKSVG